jgi:hypothetical protein
MGDERREGNGNEDGEGEKGKENVRIEEIEERRLEWTGSRREETR